MENLDNEFVKSDETNCLDNNLDINEIISKINNSFGNALYDSLNPLVEQINFTNKNISTLNQLMQNLPEYKNLKEKYLTILHENIALKSEIGILKKSLQDKSQLKLEITDTGKPSIANLLNQFKLGNIVGENIVLDKNLHSHKDDEDEDEDDEDEDEDEDQDEDEDEDEDDEDEDEDDEDEDEDDEDEDDNKGLKNIVVEAKAEEVEEAKAEEEEEEAEEEEAEEEEAEEEEAEEEEAEEEEAEEEEAEEEEAEEEEVYEVTINSKLYYTNDNTNGYIYENNNGDVGDEIGYFKNSIVTLNK